MMEAEINYWSDLEGKCPINIDRIKKYYNDFQSYFPSKIDGNLNKVKENLFSARSSLDSMFIALIQILYDREILVTPTDKVLYAWMVDNISRYLSRLDENQEHFLIKFDEADPKESGVGISRLSAYAKMLRVSVDSIIFESLLKSTQEYLLLKDDAKKIKKEPRTFLYILFQVMQVTFSVVGSMVRERTQKTKKALIQTIPVSYQSLMGEYGQDMIEKGYKQETGNELSDEMEEDLQKLSESEKELFGDDEND